MFSSTNPSGIPVVTFTMRTSVDTSLASSTVMVSVLGTKAPLSSVERTVMKRVGVASKSRDLFVTTWLPMSVKEGYAAGGAGVMRLYVNTSRELGSRVDRVPRTVPAGRFSCSTQSQTTEKS